METEQPEVTLIEGFLGGFELEGWYIPDGHDGYFGFDGVYVTIEDARRLIDEGLATYRGYRDTFEEAAELMRTNALPHEGQVRAYGSWHVPLTYDEAVHTATWFRDHDVHHGIVDLARVSKDAFELVAFGEDSEGVRLGVDSDYVTLDVGRQLYLGGFVGVMALAHETAELDDPATCDRLREEQLWG
jgi:hypothetical protein